MIRISQYIAAGVAAASLACGAARADTLMDALAAAYDTNPLLAGQRAQLRATDEELIRARALILPTIEGNASIGYTYNEGLSFFELGDPPQMLPAPMPGRDSTPRTYGLTLSQPIFRGGLVGGARNQVRANIGREAEILRNTEQTVLLDAVAAYMDVRRAESVVEIRLNNVDVLDNQRIAATNRFNLGEVTRTDVAQAESRLALARADLTTAQAQLQQQRAAFERIVGFPPGTLDEPPPPPPLPETLEEATGVALSLNPQLGAAQFAEEAARENIRVARSDLFPQITVDGSWSRRERTQYAGDWNQGYQITAGVRVPLFSGGLQQAEVRQARQLAERARHDLTQERRATTERVTTAWTSWLAAGAVVRSAQAAVEASDLAFQGVSREGEVGLRTTLDVLDAEQEVLNARVTLAAAERDAYVAAYQVLAAMGMLNVEYLGVPVTRYDPDAYSRRIRTDFFGTSID